jgi:hypothetical protein
LHIGITSFPNTFKDKKYDDVRDSNKGWHWPKLKKAYEIDGYINEKGQALIPEDGTMNHCTLSASRSRRKPLHFCDVTGFEALYRDPKSKLRYAHQGVYHHIRLRIDGQGYSKKYLELRGEVTELK